MAVKMKPANIPDSYVKDGKKWDEVKVGRRWKMLVNAMNRFANGNVHVVDTVLTASLTELSGKQAHQVGKGGYLKTWHEG